MGETSIGLLLGPAALGVVSSEGTLAHLSDIGVILLMFLAGLETDTVTMRRVSLPAFAVAIGGVVLPLGDGLHPPYRATYSRQLHRPMFATRPVRSQSSCSSRQRAISRSGRRRRADSMIKE